MHIIQLTTELRLAGAEKVILELTGALVKRGHEVTVVSLQAEPQDLNHSIIPELKALGVRVVSLGLSKFSFYKIFGLRSLLKQLKPDLIHAHMIHSNLLSRFFSPKNIPIVNTVHIAERRSSKKWHFLLDRWTFSRKVTQTCVSQAVAEHHSGKIGVDVEKLPVVYNGITYPAKLTEEGISDFKKELGVNDFNQVLGSVGRLNAQKGYERLLILCQDLTTKIPEGEQWALVIIGEGEEREVLEQLARRLPDNLRVIFPGFRKDASSAVGAFDCFLMPSLYEGFGLTLIEAMNHGLPIVCTEVDSLPELMLHYNNGFCVPWSEFGDSILKAVDYKKVDCDVPFTADIMTDNYLEIYKRLSI